MNFSVAIKAKFEMPYAQKVQRVCDNCGKDFERAIEPVSFKRYFCGTACYHAKNRGDGHGCWSGGRWLSEKGYWMVFDGPGRRRYEHIVIAEKALGRRLKRGEVVHHINGDKTDNRNTNLLICTSSYHAALHQAMSMKYAQLIEV